MTGEVDHHQPVLVDAVLDLLDPQPGETVVDCTAGRGGHALLLGRAVGPGGRVIAFDRDPANLSATLERLEGAGVPCHGVHDSFVRIAPRLEAIPARADVVLADLGFSSNQMADPRRGFSFQTDGPLDMRLDPGSATTAADLLRALPEAELARLIRTFGEEPFAPKIARKLAQVRTEKPIETSAELASLVVEAYGARARSSRMHPATRTFMALRIAVNEELEALAALLESVDRAAGAMDRNGWLRPGARVAIIGFHSLEDRLVKRAFASLARSGLATLLTKRPLTAGPEEVAANPRARSAKLRAVRMNGLL